MKKNLLEILSLAELVENNEIGRTEELKDYSLPSTGIFDTKKRESKQDVVWNTKLPYFCKGFPGQKKSATWNVQHTLVHSVSPRKHQPDCTHTTKAQWLFVWSVLDVQKLSEQVARHLETLDKGPEPSKSSHRTLPGEREGYLQWNLDAWQPQV